MLDIKSPQIMGILNVTPDSFSDGGSVPTLDDQLFAIERLIEDGADIIDVGAESTRPGASFVSVEEEKRRLEPLLSVYKRHFSVPLSLDSTKSSTVRWGLSLGVDIVNDISSFSLDNEMLDVVSKANCPYILMHMQETPEIMQRAPQYQDVVEDVYEFLKVKRDIAKQQGVDHIWLDPGIGFGKTVEHNVLLLRHLDRFQSLGCPIVLGTSNKSFIHALVGGDVEDRLEGTIISNMIGIMKGATILRVHNVKAMKRSLKMWDAICHD